MVNVGIVGTGSRASSFANGLVTRKSAQGRAKLTALCDINASRLEAAGRLYGHGAKQYSDYKSFLAQDGLDAVIVTTPCDSHAELAIQALNAGKYVLCEKAMALNPEDLRAMLEAEKKSGKGMQLGLCLRYADFMRELIPIVRRKEIGDVVMTTALETLEGGSHFRRWHRLKKLSGGILLQKGTHTLDLINWIMDEKPKSISAIGGRDVFKARKECAGRRCLGCPEKLTCSEYVDIEGIEKMNELFRKAEDVDGYIWDRCAFDPEADIYDNAIVQVEYENGKRASYAISLFYEKVGIEREFAILGTEGRIDVSRRREEIIVHRRFTDDVIHYKLQGHGEGFEEELGDFLTMVETGKRPVADSEAGYWSAIEGLAAEKSIEEGRTIQISELIQGNN